jgi:hypothetical protein
MALRWLTKEELEKARTACQQILVSKWRKRARLPRAGQHGGPTWPLEASQAAPNGARSHVKNRCFFAK